MHVYLLLTGLILLMKFCGIDLFIIKIISTKFREKIHMFKFRTRPH